MIVPKSVAETAKTEDFNSGKAMIGTGPYRYAEYVGRRSRGAEAQRSVLGSEARWDNVRFRMIPSAPARVAALLAGDVQMIEGVPTADIAQLEERQARFAVVGGVEPDHLSAYGFEPREELTVRDHHRRQAAGSQSAARSARAAGDQQDDRSRRDRVAHHGRLRRLPLVSCCPSSFSAPARHLKPDKYDPAGRQEAAGRCGLSERIRLDAARAEQSLHQRCCGRAGRRAVPVARRHSDQARDDAVERVLFARIEARVLASCWRAGAQRPARRRRRCARCLRRSMPSRAWAPPIAAASQTPASTRC